MKITVLCENTTHCDLPGEHGLSLYIEACGKKFLFDTGQSKLFAQNAKALGIDLSDIDFAVLSHGHYDHGGGLYWFLKKNKYAPVYATERAFLPHYNRSGIYIGLEKGLIGSSRFIMCDDKTEIAPGLTLFTCNDREGIMNNDLYGFTEKEDDELQPDTFRHEQYLLISEGHNRVLISGCSHKGVINLTEWFLPDHLIGGFHFSTLPLDKTLAGYARKLNEYPTAFHTCHCTGERQFDFMKHYMDNLDYLSTGTTIEI